MIYACHAEELKLAAFPGKGIELTFNFRSCPTTYQTSGRSLGRFANGHSGVETIFATRTRAIRSVFIGVL